MQNKFKFFKLKKIDLLEGRKWKYKESDRETTKILDDMERNISVNKLKDV